MTKWPDDRMSRFMVPAPLAGRAVLVTGGSSGIGRAIALACARAGADVALTFRANETGAREVEREIGLLGRRAIVIRLDLTDDRSVRALGAAARDALGRLDVWVNNAGADILTGPGASLSVAEMLGAQEEGGVIINMSWDHALTGMPGLNPQLFAAVKGAVLAFSKSLARSVAPRVRVNVLAPGWIETSFAAGDDEQTERMRRRVAESTPLKRWGTP